MARKQQFSFTGGELDPKLHARVDLAKYATGAARLLNWIVHPYGGASNRSGTEFISFCGSSADPTRLVEFALSPEDTAVLEFGNGYMGVIVRGERIAHSGGTNAGMPYFIETPYGSDLVFDLVFEQTNDVLRITTKARAPMELSRYANDDWRLAPVDLSANVGPPQLLSMTISGETRPLYEGEYSFPVDYIYQITTVDKSGRESLPSGTIGINNDLTLRGFSNTLHWSMVEGADYYCVYRMKGGSYGLVGYVFAPPGIAVGAGLDFKDENQQPDPSRGVPRPNNPFQTAGQWPRASSQFQQRSVYGGSADKPNLVVLSQSGDFRNFTTSFPTRDSDSISFALSSRNRQDILFFLAVEDLLVFTMSGEWRVRGTDEGSLTPASIDARQQSSFGCSPTIPPILVQDEIFFVQAKGQTVRSIAYDFAANKYKGQNLSLLAGHLFKDRHIIQVAYAQAPYSTLYFVLSDGRALSFTYLKDEEVFAWAPIETDGSFESVAVVSEGDEDVPYFVVRRYTGGQLFRMIERLHKREIKDVKDAFHVDCGLSYDKPAAVSLVDTSAVLSVLEGHGFNVGDEVEIDGVIGFNRLDDDGNPVPVGMINAAGVPYGGVTTVTATASTRVQVALSTEGFGPYAGGGNLRKRISTVNGLQHLEGRLVSGLADGVPVVDLPVYDGRVTIPFKAGRIHLGLPFESELETLDIDVGAAELNGELRNIQKCNVHVEKTVGLRYAPGNGQVFYSYEPNIEAGEVVTKGLFTGVFEGKFEGDWNRYGRMVFRASLTPATILAVVPQFDAGGDAADGGK